MTETEYTSQYMCTADVSGGLTFQTFINFISNGSDTLVQDASDHHLISKENCNGIQGMASLY